MTATKTEAISTLTLTREAHPNAFAALKALPVWVWNAFSLRAPLPRAEWHLTATASQFWGLSGLAGQLESVAVNAGSDDHARNLYALRCALNEAANNAIKEAV